jgi:hypothetical protein
MKKQRFIVELEFAEKIVDDNDIIKITDNIARALHNEVEYGIGLACDDDNYTKKITVSHFNNDYISEIKIVYP